MPACLPATDSGLAMPFDFGCRIHAKSAHEATNEPPGLGKSKANSGVGYLESEPTSAWQYFHAFLVKVYVDEEWVAQEYLRRCKAGARKSEQDEESRIDGLFFQSPEAQLLLFPASTNLNNPNFYSRSWLFPNPDESGRTRPRCRWGPGRRSPPPASFRAECVRIISLLDTNNHAGPGGQTCPLVDARPGAEARRHDRALVDAGRTELVVWGIGSSIMVDHDNCPCYDGRPRTNASFADARSHRQGPKSLPHTTDNTPDSPQPSSSSVLKESDHLKSPGIISGAVSVEPVHRDSSHGKSDRTDEVAERMLVDARRIRGYATSDHLGKEERKAAAL
ncbi:hypothetical protein THAOC_12192 [Thalassiosira oceanica]|uniref:Uncharacterized protein n=1 Tax=Thalassiosira oceanica TaxID=159749 RepID=K0SKM5_THAOC|nr:hypothetical protein THAOC_12192 [Thalassiosira oceanica]|eukprot:EJK66843.1 hypothetical protein THAOC_12192 [Thalassiosira oceanica]